MADGTLDFSGGVDSGRVTTVQSAINPDGLPRNFLAWSDNATMRGGTITPRPGWNLLCRINPGYWTPGTPALYQGGFLYTPDFANPYLMLQVGGQVVQVRVDDQNQVVNLSQQFGLFNPPSVAQVWMEQGEEFLVIQAGDLTAATPTLPLFWDGTTLWRSRGLTGNATPGQPTTNQLPAAGPMSYYQNRLFYAQGRQVSAGDIVLGAAGTANYEGRDSILYVTENPLAIGGDGFTVPSSAGNITAVKYTAALNTTLTGTGPLYLHTRRQVFQLNVPISRADWIATGNAATGSNTQTATMTVAQVNFGAVGDRCVALVNGDQFYKSLEPAIRSLFIDLRYFNQWGNKQISRNENRILQFENRALLATTSGINFDNRLLMTALPVQTPVGVAFQAIIPLDFDILGGFGQEGEDSAPAWEGMLEGLDVLQLFEGDFGGLQRAFAVVHNKSDGGIDVWELTGDGSSQRTDNGDNRITWYFETPAWTWGQEFDLKQLAGGELWIDAVSGTVDFSIQYRPDADPCWHPWLDTQLCVARNTCEDVNNPVCYPVGGYCDGYNFPITLPEPPNPPGGFNRRPVDRGYTFQVKVQIKGYCRVRGLVLYANPVERTVFDGLNE